MGRGTFIGHLSAPNHPTSPCPRSEHLAPLRLYWDQLGEPSPAPVLALGHQPLPHWGAPSFFGRAPNAPWGTQHGAGGGQAYGAPTLSPHGPRGAQPAPGWVTAGEGPASLQRKGDKQQVPGPERHRLAGFHHGDGDRDRMETGWGQGWGRVAPGAQHGDPDGTPGWGAQGTPRLLLAKKGAHSTRGI